MRTRGSRPAATWPWIARCAATAAATASAVSAKAAKNSSARQSTSRPFAPATASRIRPVLVEHAAIGLAELLASAVEASMSVKKLTTPRGRSTR